MDFRIIWCAVNGHKTKLELEEIDKEDYRVKVVYQKCERCERCECTRIVSFTVEQHNNMVAYAKKYFEELVRVQQ